MCSSFEKTCSDSSIEANRLACPSPANLNPTAFEECTARVRQVAEEVKFGMLSDRLNKLSCPITAEFPKDPVLTNCGHIFDRILIQQWKDNGNTCAVCRTSLTEFTPIRALREFIEERQPKDPVLTCSNFKGQDQLLAAKCLELAQVFTDKKDYAKALEFYSTALQYTNASADYAPIPKLYDELRQPEEAALSRLYLSLYKLEEKNIPGAIETLESCRGGILRVSSLITGLKLLLCPSPENIAWAMKEATDQKNPDDGIFIYNQILRVAPDRLDAYQQLIPLTKNPKEKGKLLLKAAEIARVNGQFDLEMIFRKEAENPLISDVIYPEAWANAQTINLPPYPKELQAFLAGDCTIWPGKKRSETHIVVPMFPQVAINGAPPIPLTLDSLNQLDQSSGGPGYRYLSEKIPKNIPAEKEFHYAVMTNDVVPLSLAYRTFALRKGLLPQGYEVPSVFDVARAALWENRRSGKRCFDKDPSTYACYKTFTRCKEVILGHPVFVGSFSPSGLEVGYRNNGYKIGLVGWRSFRP